MTYLVIKTAAGATQRRDPRADARRAAELARVPRVEDVDAGRRRRSRSSAARSLAGPFPIGPGTIAIVRDPQGGVFALYAGEFDE